MRALRLTLGGDRRTVFEVREGESVTIGRDPGCTIQANHHSVSPVHCLIEFRSNRFVLVDLNSAAGVLSDGKKYKHLHLRGGTEFFLGQIGVSCEEGFAESAPLAPPKPPPPGRLPAIVRRVRPSMAAFEEFLGWAFSLVTRAPAFCASAVLHAVAFLLIYDIPYLYLGGYNSGNIVVSVEPAADAPLDEELEPPEDFVFEDPPPLPEMASDDAWLVEPEHDPSGRLEIGPGIIGIGGGIGDTGAAFGSSIYGLRGLSKGAQEYIAGLRRTGVDVAFVMDTTSSMEGFIQEAKAVVDRLITGLVAVVPDLRMAIVAFRDKDDAYVTHALEFSVDRFEILNFLELLAAEGGGDEEEALFEGLNRSIRHLFWRPGAARVVLLVGDAGYHREDEPRLFRLLDEFKTEQGVVHAIWVGEAPPAGAGIQPAGLEAFSRIARACGGECVQLAEHSKVFRTVMSLAFSDQFGADVAFLADRAQHTRTDLYIIRKSRGGDREWLLEKLKRAPVHPRLVSELIATASQRELSVLVDYLESGSISATTKWAALYILRKTIKKPIAYNPNLPAEDQRAQLRSIRQMVADSPRQEVASPFPASEKPVLAEPDPRRAAVK